METTDKDHFDVIESAIRDWAERREAEQQAKDEAVAAAFFEKRHAAS